jgi:hypothetical protein
MDARAPELPARSSLRRCERIVGEWARDVLAALCRWGWGMRGRVRGRTRFRGEILGSLGYHEAFAVDQLGSEGKSCWQM